MRLHDYLEYWARQAPDLEFAEFGARRISYARAAAEVDRIAGALLAAGLELGDRVAILAKNCPEFALFYFAASKAGAVPVTLNYRLAPPEWVYVASDAGARLLLARGDLVEAIDAVRAGLPKVERWVAIESELPGWERWSDFVGGEAGALPGRRVGPECDLYQMYTSGTTGRPKGVVITQRAACEHLQQLAPVRRTSRGERSLVVAPLYHAAAAVTSFATVAAGGTLVIHEDFDAEATVRALSEHRIGEALLVPAMIQACLVCVPDAAERRYEQLRHITYGASPIAEHVLRSALEVFGCDFIQGYGMTEVTAAATALMPADHERALRERPELLLSAGRPLLGTEIRVVDERDRPVPHGTMGEIAIRGPQLMRGYWNLPEATQAALRGGWMHTGDAGVLDAQGYLFVRDRVTDMIVSGAENIYPRQVEDVLFEHPGVADAAVIGVPDEKWGEAVKAVVVLRAGARASESDLIGFCRSRIGAFKCPGSVDFADELPRNPTGKVLKRLLREPYWAGRERGVN